MALTYGEWRRSRNEYGTHAEYEEYLWNLAETARKANQSPVERRRYTRDEVISLITQAANLVQELHEYESSDTIMADDAVNLTVNVALYRLDHPGASLAEVIVASYPDVEVDVPEKGSPEWNAALVRKVTGWLA